MKKIFRYVIIVLLTFIFVIPANAECLNYHETNQMQKLQTIALTDTQSPPTPQKTEEETILNIILSDWRNLWSVGDKKFTFKLYDNVYLNSDEFLASDSQSPTTTLMKGWEAYSTAWEPYMNQHLHPWRIYRLNVNKVAVVGDIAWSNLTLYGKGILDSQEFLHNEQITHIWRKVDGQWRIVHESVTGPVNI
ncbi:nuclear transport factor 2 family protein [Nostoc sphaeroides]|uniref:SnoaL-like domain-containing protein n=1 Tax=Nostoc sphaeroides CCNUC1 TaxID=2653204 RepID=A0A5P8WI18_9NOSO|nr:nuclear transport factor 2 family protein [Nostoc sphaeroides]QFS52517.1 hypothetical protein GXM_10272 [Nostoc sphaeroides CCNUC1]